MSKPLNIALYLACILMLTGCNQDTLLVPTPDNAQEQVPAEIAMSASLIQTEVSPTRSTGFVSSLENQKIGIIGQATYSETDKKAYAMNLPFTFQDRWLKADASAYPLPEISNRGNLIYPLGAQSLEIVAYIPRSEQVNEDLPKIAVRSSLVTEAAYLHAATDPLWSQIKVTPDNLSPTFEFTHCMAKLNMYVTTTSPYFNYTIKNIILTLDRKQTGEMDLGTGKCTAENTKSQFAVNVAQPALLPDQSNTPHYGTAAPQFTHTAVPGSVIQEITLTLTDDKQQDITVPVYDATHNTQITESQRTLVRGKAKTFVIRYKTENSPATRLGSQLEEHGETVIIDNLP